MSRGLTTLTIKDSGGTDRTVQFDSSTGAATGTLVSTHRILGDDGAALTGAAADTVWNGSDSGPSWTAIWKYVGAKAEAIRSLLATGIGLIAGEAHIGEIGGKSIITSASVTRPADTNAYVSGDLIANSTTAGSVTPLSLALGRINQGTGMIRRVRLKVNDAAWANATVRVHFYKNSPTCANGDNGAWSTTESEYLGACDVTLDKSFTDPFVKGVGVPSAGSEINFDCASASQNIYALLESRSAVTPASGKVFTAMVETLAN